MPKIAVLDSALASQIAAGEVVERPASALKELVENSLDAEATRIDVTIEGGGISLMQVQDDGVGMSRQDAILCVERHATSKLTSFDQLHSLGSYGFRGEALPSIASVSRFVLRTRTREDVAGTQLFISGGNAPDISEVGMAPGTQIEVRDLFYNVPARRKFLRSSGTESGHIGEVVDNAALANPTVTFTLTRDGRRAKEWLRTTSREERVQKMLGEEQIAVCRGERGPLAVEAYLGPPERARAGSAGLKLFCNDRPIRDRALLSTIAQAFGSVLERGRYPRGVVYVSLPKSLVDVNVHPQKTEVRFADARAVTDATYQILSRALAEAFALPPPARSRWAEQKNEPSPIVLRDRAPQSKRGSTLPGARVNLPEDPSTWGKTDATGASESRRAGSTESAPISSPPESVPPVTLPSVPPKAALQGDFFRSGGPADLSEQSSLEARPQQSPREAANAEVSAQYSERKPTESMASEREGRFGDNQHERWSQLKFVAQVRSTYLLCEGQKGLYVIDQHAAAERVTFHRLRKEYESSATASQSLLFPLTLDVTEEQSELLENKSEEIKRLGFDVRVHSPTTASLHTVPRLLQRASPERLIWDLISELSRGSRTFSDAVDSALSTIACHGSIRAGDVLSAKEASQLLQDLDQADFAGHCPHGRPIVAFTPWTELERRVGRR